ncbi:MAG TPA: hypothetical protein VF115_16690 [Acidimicrobiia bacterium]
MSVFTAAMFDFMIAMSEMTESISRPSLPGFTEGECATYDIDPCPTLEEMRQRVGG